MSEHDKPAGTDSVDQAMNRVLAAERDARQAVERCRAEAQEILAAAQERARAVSRRAETRIRSAHGIADAAVARALAQLREPSPRADAGFAGERECLERAVEALVDEVIGERR